MDDANDTLQNVAELYTEFNARGGKEDKHRKTMIRGIVSFGIVVFTITAGGTAWCVSTGRAIEDLFHKHTETTKAISETRQDMKEGFNAINEKQDKANSKLDTLIGAVKGAKGIEP